jgi:SDR family mycofactocin-dependent oxidoreductase
MGLLDGKVAVVTGAARGMGRSHAVELAREGADIIALDLCAQVETVGYPLATSADLKETVRLVEETGRTAVANEVDVRNGEALRLAIDSAVARLGRLDIVVPNAGIATFSGAAELGDAMWDDMIDVNLSGAFRTARAALPHLRATGTGGSIVFIGSVAGLKGMPGAAHYGAAKHGIVGLTRALANELAGESIRVNSVHPTTTDTDMVHNEFMYAAYRPDLVPNPITAEDVSATFLKINSLPVPWIDPVDVSNAVVWLASDKSRYVTGAALPVDAGAVAK